MRRALGAVLDWGLAVPFVLAVVAWIVVPALGLVLGWWDDWTWYDPNGEAPP